MNFNLKSELTKIADAIRNKKSTTDLIKPSQFAAEIESISIGNTNQDVAFGIFTPEKNYTSSSEYIDFDIGFKPSNVIVYRKSWIKGVQSINLTFRGQIMGISVASTMTSSKAAEKLVGSSYITILENGFRICGDSMYYLVANAEYEYIAVK